jgi:hypothetical protein
MRPPFAAVRVARVLEQDGSGGTRSPDVFHRHGDGAEGYRSPLVPPGQETLREDAAPGRELPALDVVSDRVLELLVEEGGATSSHARTDITITVPSGRCQAPRRRGISHFGRLDRLDRAETAATIPEREMSSLRFDHH